MNPCQALVDGTLNYKNYVSYGFRPADFALLIAQCGTTVAVEDLAPILDQLVALATSSLAELVAINSNTVDQEVQLDELIALITSGNGTSEDILTEVQAILVEVEAINDNTDGIEGSLADMTALLTTIRDDAQDKDLFGLEVVLSGTEAAAPAPGNYTSWIVVSTGATPFKVDGITLTGVGASTSAAASPRATIPAPTISAPGGETYEWRTIS